MDRCRDAGTQLTGTARPCAHGPSLEKHSFSPFSFGWKGYIDAKWSGGKNTALVALCLQPPARTDCIVKCVPKPSWHCCH